jgi:zinc-ribbon domain
MKIVRSGNRRKPMSTVECPNCGASVPAGSRFCPECGRALTETTPTEIRGTKRSRWLPDAGLLIVLLVVAGGVVLLVGGQWAWGLAALLLAAVVFLFQREAERRAVRLTLAGLWARVSAHREVVTTRSRGQLEVFRARRELAELQAARTRGFQELGRAVYEADEEGMEDARTALADLSTHIERKEAEIHTLIEETGARVRRAQAGVAPTERLESPPEPARIPEPWPPPDEGAPPEPAQVPEPSPAEVPEPSPDQPVPAPEHPPTPQQKARRKGRQKT